MQHPSHVQYGMVWYIRRLLYPTDRLTREWRPDSNSVICHDEYSVNLACCCISCVYYTYVDSRRGWNGQTDKCGRCVLYPYIRRMYVPCLEPSSLIIVSNNFSMQRRSRIYRRDHVMSCHVKMSVPWMCVWCLFRTWNYFAHSLTHSLVIS